MSKNIKPRVKKSAKTPAVFSSNPFAALLDEEQIVNEESIQSSNDFKPVSFQDTVKPEAVLVKQTENTSTVSSEEISLNKVTGQDLNDYSQKKSGGSEELHPPETIIYKSLKDYKLIEKKDSINMENIGLLKLNTPWTLWFHHDPNDWNLSGYKKITTFKTVDEYLRIMSHIHMVTSIKTINLYLFREGIDPTWEHHANANGGFWSVKVSMETGLGTWKKMCDKAVCETILKTSGDININGTVNGITITSKLMNTIVKIWVSDRKVSNNQWIDNDIIAGVNSKIIYQVISPEH